MHHSFTIIPFDTPSNGVQAFSILECCYLIGPLQRRSLRRAPEIGGNGIEGLRRGFPRFRLHIPFFFVQKNISGSLSQTCKMLPDPSETTAQACKVLPDPSETTAQTCKMLPESGKRPHRLAKCFPNPRKPSRRPATGFRRYSEC